MRLARSPWRWVLGVVASVMAAGTLASFLSSLPEMGDPCRQHWVIDAGAVARPWGAISRAARIRSRTAYCQSELRHLALAMSLYADDYDRVWLPASTDGNWLRLVNAGYCGGGGCYAACPNDADHDRGMAEASYALNKRFVALPVSKIALPSRTLLLWDAIANDGSGLSLGPPDDCAARRHQGGANYGFADGHVKWLRPDQTSMGPAALPPHLLSDQIGTVVAEWPPAPGRR